MKFSWVKGLSLVAALFAGLALAYSAEKEAGKDPVKHVNAKQAEKLVADQKVTVLDIRTPEEFKSGHIGGATNIDFHSPDFEKAIKGLSKTNSYLVHCASGRRSTQSLKVFERNHFESIYHLDGGINGWVKGSLPIEK